MLRSIALSLALVSSVAVADGYFGRDFGKVATTEPNQVNVLAQADSLEALQQQVATQGSTALDINALMAQSPTAAGEADSPRIVETKVVDWCGRPYYGVGGCKMKKVYQVVE